jgi:hypothetical protein
MLETWWGRSLVASRASRAVYAVLKCLCFCYLGLLLPLSRFSAPWLDASALYWFSCARHALVGMTVILCVIRAIPVVWEGRRYIVAGEKVPAAVAMDMTR